jgi:toxin secretion/phage lysis holin
MDVAINKSNLILGGIIAALSYVFGASWPLFGVFLLFNIADYITGIMKSRMANKINSNDGLKGIIKKLGYWLMILVSFAAGYWFIAMGQLLGIDLKITSLLGWFVLASLTVNELRSILENFVEAGYNVPKILIKGLEVANRAFNEDPDVDEPDQGKT